MEGREEGRRNRLLLGGVRVCVCMVCVCMCMREKGRERERENVFIRGPVMSSAMTHRARQLMTSNNNRILYPFMEEQQTELDGP